MIEMPIAIAVPTNRRSTATRTWPGLPAAFTRNPGAWRSRSSITKGTVRAAAKCTSNSTPVRRPTVFADLMCLLPKVACLRPYVYAVNFGSDHDLAKTAVFGFVTRVVREFVRCAEFLGDLPKIRAGSRLFGIDVQAPRLFR